MARVSLAFGAKSSQRGGGSVDKARKIVRNHALARAAAREKPVWPHLS